MSLVDRKLAWVPPRIQMIFDLRGELHDALATVEAVKSDGQLGITFIGFEGKQISPTCVFLHGGFAHPRPHIRRISHPLLLGLACLSLAVMNAGGEKVLVQGDAERFHAANELQSLVSFKSDRAKRA